MKKIIKCLCILALVSINVYIHLFSYSEMLVNNSIIFFTLIFCLLLGKDSYSYKKNTIKYVIIYIFWNMNYLVLFKHFSTFDSLINTLLLKNVVIDILAVLAVGNIILLITKTNRIPKIIFSGLFVIMYIFLKNNIFIYISIFLIGNTLRLRDLIGVKTNAFKIIDSVSVGILIFSKIILFLVLNSNLITASISDYIGTIILIYVISIPLSIYIKVFPIIGEII